MRASSVYCAHVEVNRNEHRLRPLSDSLLFRLYRGFVLPIFDYCDTVWAPPTALLSKSMERIHARFVSYKCNDIGFAKVTLAERRHFRLD